MTVKRIQNKRALPKTSCGSNLFHKVSSVFHKAKKCAIDFYFKLLLHNIQSQMHWSHIESKNENIICQLYKCLFIHLPINSMRLRFHFFFSSLVDICSNSCCFSCSYLCAIVHSSSFLGLKLSLASV
jgi:hypothetical protein